METLFTTPDKYKPYCKLNYKCVTGQTDKYFYIFEIKPYIYFLELDRRTGILDQRIVNTQTGKLIIKTEQIDAPLPIQSIISNSPNIVFISYDGGFHYTCYNVVITDAQDPRLVIRYTSSILDEHNSMVYHSCDDKIYHIWSNSTVDSNVIYVYKFSYVTGLIEKYETKTHIDKFDITANSTFDFISEDVIIYKTIPLGWDPKTIIYIYNLKTCALVSLDFYKSLGIPITTYAHTDNYNFMKCKSVYTNKCYYFIMPIDKLSFGIYKLFIKQESDNTSSPGFIFDGIPELLCKHTYITYSSMNILYELDSKLYMIDYMDKPIFSIYMLDLNPQEPGNYSIQRVFSSYEFELENTIPNPIKMQITSMQDIFDGTVTQYPYEFIDNYKYNDTIKFEYICHNPGHNLETIVIRDGCDYKCFKPKLDTVSDISGIRDMANRLELDLPDEILLDVAKLANRPKPSLVMSLDYMVEQYDLANQIRTDTVYTYSIQDEFKNPVIPVTTDNLVLNRQPLEPATIQELNTDEPDKSFKVWDNSTHKTMSTQDYDLYKIMNLSYSKI